jgi:hypothetical protein
MPPPELLLPSAPPLLEPVPGSPVDDPPPELEPGSPVVVSSVVLSVVGSAVGSSVVLLGSDDVETLDEVTPQSTRFQVLDALEAHSLGTASIAGQTRGAECIPNCTPMPE